MWNSIIKLKNYVFELNDSASVSHDFGSRKIFLLLNDSSHDPHFSACQNIETLDGIQKISNFSLHGFSRYSTPNMALQKIILTFFVFFMLKNYVFEHNDFASVSHDFGSRKIFLLLNDSSHDPHFSACQNIETLDGIQKSSNFSLHGFSRYSTPNMALQKIILTFFKLKNYVFELYGFTSIPLRFGSRKIFLLLNDSSHDTHFLICQNIETLDRTQKISNFFLHRFSR